MSQFQPRHVRQGNSAYVILLFLFMAGLFCGSYLDTFLSTDQRMLIVNFMQTYTFQIEQGERLHGQKMWIQQIQHHFQWLGAIWLSGVFVITAPLIFIIIFVKGLLIGFVIAEFVRAHSWNGLLFACGFVIPSATFTVPTFIVVGSSTLQISAAIMRSLLQRRSDNWGRLVLSHGIILFVAVAVLVLCCWLETYVFSQWVERLATRL